MKRKQKKAPTRQAVRIAPMIQVGGDSDDKKELLRIFAANLEIAVTLGQREIVASLIQGMSSAFTVSNVTITNSNFQS